MPLQYRNTIFNNGHYTTNIPTDPHTITTTDIKTNMRYIHTSIVSRHLATRGNIKILRTPPPYIISSEGILPRLTHRTLAQLRTNKSQFLKSYLDKVDAKSHPSPLYPPSVSHIRHTSSLQLHPHTHHIITPGFVDRPRRSDCTAGKMDLEDGWMTTSGKIGIPPLARVMGVGRQQQQLQLASEIVRTGIPQGSKLSPSLFNYYIADMPMPTPPIKRVCYADDIRFWASGP